MSNTATVERTNTSRDELAEHICKICDDIKKLLSTKNISYGNPDDGFYNFREASRRIENRTDVEGMMKMLMVYVDKHWVALTQNNIRTPELKERFMDIVLYSLIAITMIDKEL